MIDQLAEKFSPKKPGQTGQPAIAQDEPDPEIDSKAILTHCQPWCGRCGGWQAIETVWSDGRVDVACRTCKHPMPDRPVGFRPKAGQSAELTTTAGPHTL